MSLRLSGEGKAVGTCGTGKPAQRLSKLFRADTLHESADLQPINNVSVNGVGLSSRVGRGSGSRDEP